MFTIDDFTSGLAQTQDLETAQTLGDRTAYIGAPTSDIAPQSHSQQIMPQTPQPQNPDSLCTRPPR
jgi:hypothetical protein